MDVAAISTGLTQNTDGIWYSTKEQSVSYPSEGHDACLRVEDQSFWFRHRNACITAVAEAYPPQGTLVEVGGGNGFVARGLQQAGFSVALLEPGQQGASNAKRRGLETVICATTDSAGFTPETLPAIGLFDVVEHIEHDRTFLESCHRLLVPQGRIYITVPAYQALWSDEDILAGHYRRYTLKQITTLLESAGFTIEFSSYIFRFLPLPILLLRALPYRLGRKPKPQSAENVSRDHATKNGFAHSILNTLLTSEISRLKSGKPMRFGGSCLLIARKKS